MAEAIRSLQVLAGRSPEHSDFVKLGLPHASIGAAIEQAVSRAASGHDAWIEVDGARLGPAEIRIAYAAMDEVRAAALGIMKTATAALQQNLGG